MTKLNFKNVTMKWTIRGGTYFLCVLDLNSLKVLKSLDQK